MLAKNIIAQRGGEALAIEPVEDADFPKCHVRAVIGMTLPGAELIPLYSSLGTTEADALNRLRGRVGGAKNAYALLALIDIALTRELNYAA